MRRQHLRRLFLEPLEQRCLLSLSNPIISEFLAGHSDPLANDWLEIYNPGSAAVDLTGWILRDDSNEWVFPAMSLGGGQFRQIMATDVAQCNPAGVLDTGFKLSAGGERLQLLDPVGTVVHGWDPYPAQKDDISFGVGQQIMETTVLAAGADAKYLKPTDNTLQSTFYTTGFNDTGWSDGSTGLGYRQPRAGFRGDELQVGEFHRQSDGRI